MRPALLLPLALMALAACKSEAPVGADAYALMQGEVAWQVSHVGGAPVPEGVTVTMQMLKEGLIGGTSGCNRFNGRIAVVDGVLHLGELAGTRMMCGPRVMQVEGAFHAAMAEARAMVREGGDLVLRNGAGAEVLRAHR